MPDAYIRINQLQWVKVWLALCEEAPLVISDSLTRGTNNANLWSFFVVSLCCWTNSMFMFMWSHFDEMRESRRDQYTSNSHWFRKILSSITVNFNPNTTLVNKHLIAPYFANCMLTHCGEKVSRVFLSTDLMALSHYLNQCWHYSHIT